MQRLLEGGVYITLSLRLCGIYLGGGGGGRGGGALNRGNTIVLNQLKSAKISLI